MISKRLMWTAMLNSCSFPSVMIDVLTEIWDGVFMIMFVEMFFIGVWSGMVIDSIEFVTSVP